MSLPLPPSERRFNALLWRSLLLPIVLLLLVAVVFTWATARVLANAERVRVSDEAISRANRALALGVDMETGVRGYQITGDRLLLEPYEKGRKQIGAEIDRLARLVGTPEQ